MAKAAPNEKPMNAFEKMMAEKKAAQEANAFKPKERQPYVKKEIEKKPEPVAPPKTIEQPVVVEKKIEEPAKPISTPAVISKPAEVKQEVKLETKAEESSSNSAANNKPAAGGEGDFKNSLAALIGRGKPTYKKPVVEEKKVEEAPKVKVDVFNNESSDDEGDVKAPKPDKRNSVMDDQIANLVSKAVTKKRGATTKFNLDKFDLEDSD